MVYFVVTIYIYERREIQAYQEYIQMVKPIVERYHGRYIVRSETITPLSTKWQPERVIIIEFDTREQLDACFSSQEYRSIASLREQSVDSRAIIVEAQET